MVYKAVNYLATPTVSAASLEYSYAVSLLTGRYGRVLVGVSHVFRFSLAVFFLRHF